VFHFIFSTGEKPPATQALPVFEAWEFIKMNFNKNDFFKIFQTNFHNADQSVLAKMENNRVRSAFNIEYVLELLLLSHLRTINVYIPTIDVYI